MAKKSPKKATKKVVAKKVPRVSQARPKAKGLPGPQREGRPITFESAEQMQEMIDEFFAANAAHPTITGLALHLGFAGRQSFYDYEKLEQFSYTIKRARAKVEQFYEGMLFKGGAGSIFALKNFGWSDRQEIDHTSAGKEMKHFTLTIKPDESE